MYDMFPRNGTNTLSWFDDVQSGDFEIEVSTNKGNVPKVYQSVNILVDDNHNTLFTPIVTVTTGAQTSTIGDRFWDFRVGSLVATVRNDASDNRIISNYAKFKVKLLHSESPTVFMRILNIVNTFRTKYPNPFNYR